ncbi:MAG: hypothetical protein AABX69_05465, partial [Nanoarchaeota archaeon]
GELELYNKVSSLPKLFESGQLRQLKYVLDFIRLQKEALKKKCPEDKVLFDYVSSQHDLYLSKLMSRTTGTAKVQQTQAMQSVQQAEKQPINAGQAIAVTQTIQPAAHVATEEVYISSPGTDLASANKVVGKTDKENEAKNNERVGNIEDKIDELKSLSKATVKPPQLLQQ